MLFFCMSCNSSCTMDCILGEETSSDKSVVSLPYRISDCFPISFTSSVNLATLKRALVTFEFSCGIVDFHFQEKELMIYATDEQRW